MRLYDIPAEFFALQSLIEEAMVDDEGNPKELDDSTKAVIAELVDQFKDDFTTKVERSLNYRANVLSDADECLAQAASFQKEADRLKARARVHENKGKAVAFLIQVTMDRLKLKKMETVTRKLWIQRNTPSLLIDDPDKVPVDYKRVDLPYVVGSEVKEALLADKPVPGARLVYTEGLRVR